MSEPRKTNEPEKTTTAQATAQATERTKEDDPHWEHLCRLAAELASKYRDVTLTTAGKSAIFHRSDRSCPGSPNMGRIARADRILTLEQRLEIERLRAHGASVREIRQWLAERGAPLTRHQVLRLVERIDWRRQRLTDLTAVVDRVIGDSRDTSTILRAATRFLALLVVDAAEAKLLAGGMPGERVLAYSRALAYLARAHRDLEETGTTKRTLELTGMPVALRPIVEPEPDGADRNG